MAFRPNLLAFATAFLGLASPVSAAGLSAIDAFSCAGQGTGYASQGGRENWTPEYYRSAAAFSAPGDAASTVKLRIVYEMGDRIEIDHCGGTVIDSNWVVTAGHCVAADRSWSRIEIVAGDEHLEGANAIKRTTSEAVCHAGFKYQTLENDIALLRVDNPFPARVRPVAIDTQNAPSLRRGEIGMGHGWPVTGLRAGDRYLNRTPLQVHGVDMRSYITVTNAASPSGGLCRGESGGPILSNGPYGKRLAGVLSGIQPGTENHAGDECMLGNYEMYFTPIAAHRRWIDNVKSVCMSNPAACGGKGTASMVYAAAAPAYAQPQYTSYQSVQSVEPAYQTVAYVEPTPQPVYINVGNAFGDVYAAPISNTWGQAHHVPVAAMQVALAPAPAYYQPVAPTYVDTGISYGATMAPIYDDHRAYAPAQAYSDPYGSYTVAYAQPGIIYGSAFPRHAR